MEKIELITVTITHIGVTVTAIGAGDQPIEEKYKADENGILDCQSGNFDDELELGKDEHLLEALRRLTEQAQAVFICLDNQ